MVDYQGRAEMRLIWGESFSSSAMMSCKNMCIMKKGIDKCDYVGFSIFPKILVMCPSHFNPNRSSLNVPEHILAVHIFPLSILFLSSQTGSFKIWTACTIGLSDFARRLELKLTTLLFFLKKITVYFGQRLCCSKQIENKRMKIQLPQVG